MNKYQRKINGQVIDVYDILAAYKTNCPAIDHAIKKLLMPGGRGVKTRRQDIAEAIDSLSRSLAMLNNELIEIKQGQYND